jgi:hypothetical protein
MEKTDEEKAADEMLILRLLAGFHEDENGRAITSRLDKDSPEERQARKVLAQQLRDGILNPITRELLALAIDPETPSPHPTMRPTRKVVFQRPPKGGTLDWARERVIIYDIKDQISQGKANQEAVTDVAYRHRLNRSRVWEIWTAYNVHSKGDFSRMTI